ncbi:MAG: leucine-rich repeat protein [Clostridia bacterium]|nr:leucine-rich repeat protein [Clostridia bacterium]
MKIKALILALVLAFLLGGCAFVPDEQADGTRDQNAEYLNTIAELQAQLEMERAGFAESEALYQQTIATLEAKIALLSHSQSPSQGEEESVTFRYKLEGENAVITGYEGNATLLTVPDTLDGHPVTSIGERAFEGTSVSAIVIPDGVQSIGWFAFYNCRDLVNVTLPQSVSSIGYAVFDGCGALTVFGAADSYAERYARSYGLAFVAK